MVVFTLVRKRRKIRESRTPFFIPSSVMSCCLMSSQLVRPNLANAKKRVPTAPAPSACAWDMKPVHTILLALLEECNPDASDDRGRLQV